MFLLKTNTFQLEASSPVVKAEEAVVVATAEKIIAAAKAEAQKILTDAKEAYQAEKERGYADGITEGKEEILIQKMNLLDETIGYMEGVENKIVELVIKALKKCVAEIGDEELVFQIVHKSMQAVVRNQRQITVKVSPLMVPVVKGRVDELIALFPTLVTINVQADEHLVNSACVVETEAGLVEASVDGQLSALRKSIEHHFQH